VYIIFKRVEFNVFISENVCVSVCVCVCALIIYSDKHEFSLRLANFATP